MYIRTKDIRPNLLLNINSSRYPWHSRPVDLFFYLWRHRRDKQARSTKVPKKTFQPNISEHDLGLIEYWFFSRDTQNGSSERWICWAKFSVPFELLVKNYRGPSDPPASHRLKQNLSVHWMRWLQTSFHYHDYNFHLSFSFCDFFTLILIKIIMNNKRFSLIE